MAEFRATNPLFPEGTQAPALSPEGSSDAAMEPQVHAPPPSELDNDDTKALVPRAPVQLVHPATSHVTVANTQQAVDASKEEEPSSPQKVVLERGAVRHSESVGLKMCEVSAGNERVGLVQVSVERAEDRVVQRVELEQTPSGDLRLKTTQAAQRTIYRATFTMLFLDAHNDKLALEDGAAPEVKPSKCERCVDIFCQSCTCSCVNPFKRQSNADIEKAERKKMLKRREIMTPILQRGRAKGWNIFQKFTFPFVNHTIRDIWVVTELIATILSFALSVASFSLGNNEAFKIVHLVLSIISTILAVVDGIVNLSECRSCKHMNQLRQKEEGDQSMEQDNRVEEENKGKNSKCCRECQDRSKGMFDLARMILTEIILYPLLICDMFDIVTEEGYKPGTSAEEIVSYVLFIFQSLLMVGYVYLLRLAVLGSTIYHVQKFRTPPNSSTDHVDDKASRVSGLYFQVYFFLHVFAQMIAQVLMLIAIAVKIQYDNRDMDMTSSSNIMMSSGNNMMSSGNNMMSSGDMMNSSGMTNSEDDDDKIRVTGYLWFMLVSGYVLPVCGILTFFVVMYYWTQEFPIGICIDLISLLEAPGCNHLFYWKESTKEAKSKLDAILRYVHIAELKKQYKGMRSKGFLDDKFTYPFRSPVLVFLCLIYAIFQFGFILCAALTVDENGDLEIVVLNGNGGWVLFYVFSVIFGVLANFYVFTVAAFWVGVLVLILGIICVVIMTLCFLFIMFVACSGNSSSNNDRYRR